MKDRLSLNIDNGQAEIREAVTVLRNGGTAAQSGLVGITNATRDEADPPVIPETIFNVQSTGDSNIRFTSGPSKDYRSCLELLGVSNTRSSGLHFSYDPEFDDAYIDAETGYGYYEPCVNPGVTDKTVSDISLIRPSGDVGMEFSHISLSERGYVSIGLTRVHEQRHFEANAPLTIAYVCDNHQDSGTISIHEQASSPADHADFGKLYVKPYSVGGRTQAIYFKDDGGTETNLVRSQDLDPNNSVDGLIWGDATEGNTYGGWYTPNSRTSSSSRLRNTYYGYGAGNTLGSVSATCNTLLGYHAGSGLGNDANNNTAVGCRSLTGFANIDNSVAIGRDVIVGDDNTAIQRVIAIGGELFNSESPEDEDLAIGFGDSPLITGKTGGLNRSLVINNGTLSVTQDDISYVFTNEFEPSSATYDAVIKVVDGDSDDSDPPTTTLKFKFENSDATNDQDFFILNHRFAPSTNNPSYSNPTTPVPFAELNGDFRLKNAIRFQDGTAMSGLSYLGFLPYNASTGIAIDLEPEQSYFRVDLSNVPLAGTLSNNITIDNTFVPVQLDGTSSSKLGKMSLNALADYITEGLTNVTENCNIVIANADAEAKINKAKNTRSVFIGCDVADGVEGWQNAIMIGADAGYNATVSNPTLTSPKPVIFIGSKAGYNADDITNSIFIGEDAGNQAASAEQSIFIGPNAGQYAQTSNSIGIGKFALYGNSDTSVDESNTGNIEIVTNLLNNQRLMYNQSLSSRLNIQNTIAGRWDRRNIAIGDARLSPESPLEVRRDSIIHNENANDYIQAWYCDDQLVASIDCDGKFDSAQTSFFLEGLLADNDLSATAGLAAPVSGLMSIYENGVDTGDQVYITNRDANLTMNNGTYVVAGKLGSEYRPLWVSC
tara:strand:+ start:14725 stop:17385 length:2661 start_codon:yes stop_codon:yes gene_type:complete